MDVQAILPGRTLQTVGVPEHLPTEFWSCVLGRIMALTCGYFRASTNSLETAQEQMFDYTCGKLRLFEGSRILDLECGWGSWMRHAAQLYRARAFGIASDWMQAKLATNEFRLSGVADRCIVDVCDLQALDPPAEYDELVSLSSFADVSQFSPADYFKRTFSFLMPGGVFLKTLQVTLTGGGKPPSRFYSPGPQQARFPSLDETIHFAEAVGFELRDIENLREHYMLKLNSWLRNLERDSLWTSQVSADALLRTWILRLRNLYQELQSRACGALSGLIQQAQARSHWPSVNSEGLV